MSHCRICDYRKWLTVFCFRFLVFICDIELWVFCFVFFSPRYIKSVKWHIWTHTEQELKTVCPYWAWRPGVFSPCSLFLKSFRKKGRRVLVCVCACVCPSVDGRTLCMFLWMYVCKRTHTCTDGSCSARPRSGNYWVWAALLNSQRGSLQGICIVASGADDELIWKRQTELRCGNRK